MRGNPRIKALAASNRAAADAAALELWRRHGRGLEGLSTRAIAAELNRRGVETPRGGRWHQTSVARLLARLEAAEGTITYRESALLWAAAARHREVLRALSAHHPLLEVVDEALAALQSDGSPPTSRYRPELSRAARRVLRKAAAGYALDVGSASSAEEVLSAASRLWPKPADGG